MSKHIKQSIQLSEQASAVQTLSLSQQENIQATLALLLGPETEYHVRARAARRLARQGPVILPTLLNTLSTYPEITAPSWPWWPPQYDHCSHLLVYLSQKAHMRLLDMPYEPTIVQPIGPVLWISIIEAMGLSPYEDAEAFLCQGLSMPWETVRYAAAMTLGTRARHIALHPDTLTQLHMHLQEDEVLSVRLTAAYALLNSGENIGVEVLLQMMAPEAPEEARKAATFILATELPFPLPNNQNERMITHLIDLLQDTNAELALHAAQALGKIAEPALLETLSAVLSIANTQGQVMILTALEEMASRKHMRDTMRQKGILSHMLPLMRSVHAEVRRQACYTLATCGGEYATAVLGTITHHEDHPSHLEAIESLRVLYSALKIPARLNIIRWLVQLLSHRADGTRGTALDSLVRLLWQARLRGHKQMGRSIVQEAVSTDVIMQLLNDIEAGIRQRAVELIGLLGGRIVCLYELHDRMLYLLREDNDSGVRASIAYTCGQLEARWAIQALIQALRDQNEHVALTALNALGQLATADDDNIQSAIMELVQASKSAHQIESPLARKAQSWLRKLQKAAKRSEEQAPSTSQ